MARTVHGGKDVGGSDTALPGPQGGMSGGAPADIDDEVWRRLAEADLRASEARFRHLLRTAGDGIHILDGRGNLVLASDSFYRMLDYDEAAPPTLNVVDWDAQWSREELQTIIARQMIQPEIFRTRHRRRNGSVLDVEVHSRGVELDGQLFLYASSRDITERLQAEASIARNLAVTTALAHVLRLSLTDLPLGAILDATLGEMLGLPWLNLEQRGCIFLMDEDGTGLRMEAQRNLSAEIAAGCSRVAIGHCLCGRAAAQRQVLHKTCVDHEHDVRFASMTDHGHYCVPILGGGTLLGVINAYVAHGHSRDGDEERSLLMFADTLAGIITRKQTERFLHDSEELARTLMNASADAAVLLDRDGVILAANSALAARLPAPTTDLPGRSLFDIVPPGQAHAHRVQVEQVLADRAPLHVQDEFGGRAFDNRIYPVRDADGAITRVAVYCRDVTEQTEAQRTLEAALAELARSNRELEHHRLHLEDLVQQRTAELAAREARLRETLALNANILMTSSVGIAAYRQDGRCAMVNPAFARMAGGTEAQMLQQDFRQLRSWRASGLAEWAERVLAGGDTIEGEAELTTSFGRHLWLHCRLSRFVNGGEPHLLLVLDDVTAQKRTNDALQESERNFRTLADNVPDNIIRCDLDGRIRYINRTLEVTLGRAAGDMLGKTSMEAFPDGRFAALEQAMLRVGANGESADFEQVVPGPDGNPRYHSIRIVPEPGPDGRPVSVLAVGRDLTPQRMAEEQLRLAASVFHNSAEGVLVTDAAGTIVSVNPAFTDITGYGEAEALGRKPSLLRSDRHEPDFYRSMWQSLVRDGQWQGEIWNRRKGGEAYLEWLTINRIDDDGGTPIRYVSVFHDITETRRKDERIQHLAFHDALTGLPNRTLLQDRLQHALERARREGNRLSVTFIDLDRFKAVNDSLGHDIGDLLLQEVAQRIRERLRAMDTVARMGGDEFVVLMEDLEDAEDCACLAEKLIAEISRPMDLRGHCVEVGASMGMAFFPEDGADSLTLMKNADMAMYAAKSAGRNTYRFFQAQMQDETTRRMTMEMDLRQAIATGGLVLHYQPKVTLSDGAVCGVEALVRWHHPVQGLLPPADFIPLAEESGLIVELGAWVLEQACRQAVAWHARGLAIRIAVNVSARQLDSGDLAERIAGLTRRHGIAPTWLEIELTESAVMANPANAAALFTRLREMGVTIAVDDFGTGYSSLAYLRRLPIDVLKIDQSFVREAGANDEDTQIVKTILALGQSLKLTMVAEGIETLSQADILASAGCHMAQGYHFSRPMPADEVEDWLAARAAAADGISRR